MLKRLIPILVLLLIVGFLAAALKPAKKSATAIPTPTLQTSPVPTVPPSWNNYTNSELHFSLHFPESWRLVDNPNHASGGTTQIFSYPDGKYIGGEQFKEGDFKIEIAYLANPKKLPVEELVLNLSKDGLSGEKIMTFQDVLLGNTPAVMSIIPDESFSSYYVKLSDVMVLSITAAPSENNPTVKAILSSFSLINN